MKEYTFYPIGDSAAIRAAAVWLAENGYTITNRPGSHVTHVLLPVPSFEKPGVIKGGLELGALLSALPPDVTICGGMLGSNIPEHIRSVDLLEDPTYIAANAAITAECTLGIILHNLPRTIHGTKILIIGWGRIGKHLAKMLKKLGAQITVAARKEADLALLQSFGYAAAIPSALGSDLQKFHVICSTAPQQVMTQQQLDACAPNCLKIDLASVKGIPGDDVIWARGLPGKCVPESSGELIAQTVLRLCEKEGEV